MAENTFSTWQSEVKQSNKTIETTNIQRKKQKYRKLFRKSYSNRSNRLLLVESYEKKKIKNPRQPVPPIRSPDGKWVRSSKDRAKLFAEHLAKVFMPFPQEATENEEEMKFIVTWKRYYKWKCLPKKLALKKCIIQKDLNAKKAPEYDLITGKILKELPAKALRFLTIIYNAVLRINYYPSQWKVAQTILLPKPGKKYRRSNII